MSGRKIQSIQALRGVAVLLVLARHLLAMEEHYGGGEMALPQLFKLGDSGVDIFFVISGFIMVVISRGRFQVPGAFGSFLYKRAIRIYPLYWLYSLAVLSVFLIAPGLVRAMKNGYVDLVASFFLLPQIFPPLLGQGWTLTHEVYFYLMFALALLLPEKRLSRFLLLWGLFVAVGYNIYISIPALFDNASIKMATNPITMEFIFGACAALGLRRGWQRGDWLALIGGCALLPASSFFFDPLDIEGLRFFCFGLPALLILYGAVSLEQRGRLRCPQWLQTIGDASFSIYLSHILVVSAVGRIWSMIRQPGLWDNVIAIAAMAAAALGCGLASYRWIEQPLLRACHGWRLARRPPSIPPRRDSLQSNSSASHLLRK